MWKSLIDSMKKWDLQEPLQKGSLDFSIKYLLTNSTAQLSHVQVGLYQVNEQLSNRGGRLI